MSDTSKCENRLLQERAGRNLAEQRLDRKQQGLDLAHEEVRQQTARVQEHQARLEAILDTVAEAIISIDHHATVVDFSRSAVEMFGYAPHEVIGKNVSMLMPSPYREAHQGYIESYNRTGRGQFIGTSREVVGRRKNGDTFPMDLRLTEIGCGSSRLFVGFASDLTERDESEIQIRRLVTALEHTHDSIVITDTEGSIQYVNAAFERVSGYSRDEVLGLNPRILKSHKQSAEFYRDMWSVLTRGDVWQGRLINRTKGGSEYIEEATISPVRDGAGTTTHYVAVKRDVTEQEVIECELRLAQKMQSVGQLAAGIAHEINTPTQYVGDNTRFLQEAFAEIAPLLDTLQELGQTTPDTPEAASLISHLRNSVESADLEYLTDEIPRAIAQSLEGVQRVAKIVGAMKEFSHPGKDKQPTDLHRTIENTLTVATNEWKYVATVETDFDPDLPMVPCLADEFNQVILNLVVNAAHAIADTLGDSPESKGTITIRTRCRKDHVEVRVVDTGTGMPEEVRARVFDPFFTTKEVGKGTGQGLSIAHAVIVKKHGGTIAVESEVGKGTCFIICLPLETATEATVAHNKELHP